MQSETIYLSGRILPIHNKNFVSGATLTPNVSEQRLVPSLSTPKKGNNILIFVTFHTHTNTMKTSMSSKKEKTVQHFAKPEEAI